MPCPCEECCPEQLYRTISDIQKQLKVELRHVEEEYPGFVTMELTLPEDQGQECE